MKIDAKKMKAVNGYYEGAAEAADMADAQKAIQYKKEVTRSFISLSTDEIESKLGGGEYFATRKYDGEMNILFYDGGDAALINRSGRIRTGLPCLEDAKAALKAAGVKQAVIPSELYVDESGGRTRVFNVLAALADKNKTGTLRLASFDILEMDNQPFKAKSYGEIHEKLGKLFGKAKLCGAVECRQCRSKADVKNVYADWVEKGGAEGLVVRNETPLVYKVKPRHTIDVAVIGYSEGSGDQKNQIRALLLAMMPADNEYQIVGKTGNGLTDEDKKKLLKKLQPLTIDSRYIETDSNHVAFHMIKPELVIEVLINDVLFDTSTGNISNVVLELKNNRYELKGNVNGISLVFPVFARFRDDKKAVYEDTRLEQINDFSYAAKEEITGFIDLPKSKLLKRAVYKKESGSKLMVQKFIVWQTNKPASDYPAFVYHYTDFSSDRKEPLKRDVIVSDDKKQILEIFEAGVAENVKKGWNVVA